MKSGSERLMAANLHVSCLSGKRNLHALRLFTRLPCTYAIRMKPKDHVLETGRRLKAARNAAGITQEEAAAFLAKETGEACPPSRVGNWEQGTRLISPVALQILSRYYGASPSAIYGFSDAPRGSDEVNLLEKYRGTDDRGKRVIHGVADAQPSYLDTRNDAKKAG